MSEELKYYTIKELFSSDGYVIPIYQRNYAWGESEIIQLIQDIADYLEKDKKSKYYIGTLIVWERKQHNEIKFETIDGQQRLTTLSILLSLIKNEYPNVDLLWYEKVNLEFDSRINSTKTLQYLFEPDNTNDKDYNIAVKQWYEIAKKALPRILAEKEGNPSIKDFCSYLFEKVIILRVLVPKDTNLNHYFEIMNSRGEQLEKHEILKAKMLNILKDKKNDMYAFNLIWEACSNMERYVQYGFNDKNLPDTFFKNDNNDGNKWNVLSDMLNSSRSETDIEHENESSTGISIEELLKDNAKQFLINKKDNEEKPERFNTIIDFSNFLMHILKIQIQDQTEDEIPLNDENLIKSFELFLKDDAKNIEFVRKFGYNLLKGKFLFDKYVIKRDYLKEDSWSLKQLKYVDSVSYVNTFGEEECDDGINREILMLLSMFHVTTPTPSYKHWLNAVLKYLFENMEKKEISGRAYKEYLEELAKAFLYDRFLAKEPKNYDEIIYTNNGISKNTDIDEKKLDLGTGVENFIFNYLDYLLWKDYCNEETYFFTGRFKDDNGNLKDEKIKKFKYTFRSSVEHYYPQQPRYGEPIHKEYLNNFGNLYLISISKNSSLSNKLPEEKRIEYINNPSSTIDSIKQRIMMEYEKWNTKEIEEHGRKMKELLLRYR